MKKWLCILCLMTGSVCADSVNLFNDTQYTLKAIIYDASGTVMGQFILNPRDASEWSNNDNFGAEMSTASQSPYMVNWICMGGAAYGSCNNVAAGSLVAAQGCGGTQECGSLSGTPMSKPVAIETTKEAP